MKWINKKKFKYCIAKEYFGGSTIVIKRIVFPLCALIGSFFIGCRHLKCDGNFYMVITDYPLSLVPVLFFFFLLYICKPLNDYLCMRQEFSFYGNTITVSNYFKNYFSFNGVLTFTINEIQSITDLNEHGITIYLNLTNQVQVPFLDSNDHSFLMQKFNPEGTIKIIKNNS